MSDVDPPRDPGWSRPAKLAASLLIVTYLATVIVPPLAGPPPASDLARTVMGPLLPLVHAFALDHGYRFFAPNPGPGHSIRWHVSLPDGSTASGSIPDRDGDWPRLLYHRRFMVAEKIADAIPPADLPEEIHREARETWEPLVRGVARHVLDVTSGTAVRLEMVEHYLPDPGEVVRGEQGADIVTPLGTYAIAPESTSLGAIPPGATP